VEQARFRIVKSIFRAALELAPGERDAFIERRCAQDPALADEVRDLLAHAQVAAHGFLEGPPPLPASTAPVVRIPGYELLEQLAAGASGSVWRARQIDPRRDVALKVLRLDSTGPLQIARFRREAQILAGLDHPGIARVIESGVLEEGPLALPWIALEFVHGVTLDEYVRAVRPSLDQRLELYVQVCEAVEHAHRRGIVHRDLKPSNVMVDLEGRPRVIDFGIARATAELAGDTALLTRTGMLIGTLSFMAPEQARGERTLTPAADVYSLGAILYENLSGRLPVDLEELELLDAVRAVCSVAPVRLRRLRPELSRDLETILAKALEKDPARRYSSAGGLGADLRRHLARQPVLARRATVVYRMHQLVRRNLALSCSLAALVLALATGLAVALSGLREARQQRAFTATTLDTLVSKLLQFTTRLGFGEEERDDLEEMQALVGAQLERDPTNPRLRAALTQILTQLAVLDQARGDEASMRARIEQGRAILEQLSSELPEDVEIFIQLSASYARSGEVAHAAGRIEERDWWFERALELDQWLVSQHPGDLELVEDLGWSVERVAQSLLERGMLDHSSCLDRWRLQDAEALVRADPRNWKFVYNLSHALYYVAVFHLRRGELAEAAHHALECARQARLLRELQPGRREALAWCVFAHRCACRVLLDAGDPALARWMAEEGLERAFELVETDSDRSGNVDLLWQTTAERVDLEAGSERASVACGIEQRLERLAARLDDEGAEEAAGRLRDLTDFLAGPP
jgi:hypothetical protein